MKSETNAVASLQFADKVTVTSKEKIAVKKLIDSAEVEEVVRSYFADTPILAEVSRCESHFTQFNEDGSIHQGVANPSDIGVMQINRRFHLKESKKLGIDIFTLEGNLAYAKHLYEEQGVAPWSASSRCWKKVTKLLEAQAMSKTDTKSTLATTIK